MNRAKCVKRIFIQVASQGACEPSTNEQINEQDSVETEVLNSRTPQGWISFFTVAAAFSLAKVSLLKMYFEHLTTYKLYDKAWQKAI